MEDLHHISTTATGNPLTIDECLRKGNLAQLVYLLQNNGDKAITPQWSWLNELIDLGMPIDEIACLLFEHERDSPWIVFEPWATLGRVPDVKRHLSGCIHSNVAATTEQPLSVDRSESFQAPVARSEINMEGLHSTIESDSRRTIADLGPRIKDTVNSICGIAGVGPWSRHVLDWEVKKQLYVNDHHLAVAFGYKQPLEHMTHAYDAVNRFCSAAAELQQQGFTCDAITILVLSPKGIANLVKIELLCARRLLSLLSGLIDRSELSTNRITLCVFEALGVVSPILQQAVTKDAREGDFEAGIQVIALAAQLLCLALVSYCQAHTGPLHPFFIENYLDEFKLCGTQETYANSGTIVARMIRLTCIGDMLSQDVLAFMSNDTATQVSLITEARYDVFASPVDFVDTWGPATVWRSANHTSRYGVGAISIGRGNIVAVQGEGQNFEPKVTSLHWDKDAKTTGIEFSLLDKARFGTFLVNPRCTLTEDGFLEKFGTPFDVLGTSKAFWDFREQQLGLGLGQYLVPQYNATWQKVHGHTLKEVATSNIRHQGWLLEATFGLQVSFCTRVARRVRIKQLVADLLPTLIRRQTEPIEGWEKLRDNYRLISILRAPNTIDELQKIATTDRASFDLAFLLINWVLKELECSGLSRTGKTFKVAWFPIDRNEGPKVIGIDTEQNNYWTKILRDSTDCATFAYMTFDCLETTDHKCVNTRMSWPKEILLMETEFDRKAQGRVVTAQVEWEMRKNEVYAIGLLGDTVEVPLLARVELSTPNEPPRLVVRQSKMPFYAIARLRASAKHYPHLRERQSNTGKLRPALVTSISTCS